MFSNLNLFITNFLSHNLERQKSQYDLQRPKSPGRSRTYDHRFSQSHSRSGFNKFRNFRFTRQEPPMFFFDTDPGSCSSSSSGDSDDSFSKWNEPFSWSSDFDNKSSDEKSRRISSTTRFAHGQMIVTRSVLENGIETVTMLIYKEGQLIMKFINGLQQSL